MTDEFKDETFYLVFIQKIIRCSVFYKNLNIIFQSLIMLEAETVTGHRQSKQSCPVMVSGWEQLTCYLSHDPTKLYNRVFYFSAAAASDRPQHNVSDRHQVDDVDANHTQTNTTKTVARGAAASVAAATAANVPDELGPLPAGWQMSRTENERAFFIDHVNKRTTWVRKRKYRENIFIWIYFQG